MKKNWKKLIALSTGVVLCAASLSGCGGGGQQQSAQEKNTLPTGEVSYPIETSDSLTYWVRLSAALGTSVTNYGETPFAKEYMKQTGINVTFQHPAAGQETEVLNLLIASGDLPDIIEANWLERNPDASIAKGTILDLTDYIENYSPNLKKYLAANPDIDKTVKTDTGAYYVYPFIRGDERLRATSGFILRADWLKDLNLEVPETLDEWETVLEAFKSKCSVPIAVGGTSLIYFGTAYDICNDMFVDDSGKVVFGPAQPAYKEFLAKMHEWYEKGYIDQNFAILDATMINSNMMDGKAGVSFGAGGGQMGVYLNAMYNKGTSYDLVAAPYPVLKKGDRPQFGNKELPYSPIEGGAITGKSKHPDLAARFLDYSYGEEGAMLNNFGIEGESYEMIDGYPTYTDVITHNPDGLAMGNALPLYVRSANEGPFVQDVRYIEQYYALEQQRDALEKWSANDHEKHKMPQITLTTEESDEYSQIMSEINTYRDEMFISFVVGDESIDNYDSFVENLKSMNLDRALEIEQAAYDRFQAR